MLKKILAGCLAAVLLFCLAAFAFGEDGENETEPSGTAAEIKTGLSFSANGRSQNFGDMLDDDFGTYIPLKEEEGWLEVHSEKPVYGVYVMLFERFTAPLEYEIWVPEGDGGWRAVASGGQYLVNWHPLEEGVTVFRIFGTSRERICVSELRLYGEGEKPADVQVWQTVEKSDIMLLSAHPDDEILWFAGFLPTYAGDRGYRVQVAVMAPTGGERKLELLHAIWHCGVTAYPEFIGLVDKNGGSLEGQYTAWKGKDRVQGLVTKVIRKYRPEIIITHGENGEYGHGAHRTACAAAKDCVKYAADAKRSPKSEKKYGTWQVKKLYLHEYKENVIPCDWNLPLEKFGGKTGYEVASEAFRYYRSQIRRNWNLEPDGKVRNNAGYVEHDNSLFGLFFTTVGEDTGTGDFMEHITP